MRKLITKDIPAACRALKKFGLRDAVQEISSTSNTAKEAWDKGFDMLWELFDKATEQDCERGLYEFLAGPFEMTVEEVENLEMMKLIDMCEQLVKENDLRGFFKFAAARNGQS